ncbi:GNAT family N-acetyltransferase [Rhodococcus sp. KBS0724]|uniref:GNAT family N-acetyltransferase n=1 Tax=Rhodococcus sp. KBS0724 TaxID=1179674 RepID=UPI0021B0B98B|nr:GNAT family N-acetyltransferase [Rhodococcus sp. KBS0724]
MTSPNNVQRQSVRLAGGVVPSRMRHAISQAEHAALLAGVTVDTVTGHAELEQVFGLFEKVWQPENGNPPVHRDMMKALSHSGNYVAGAFRGGDLIGGSVAFFEEPQHRSLHSHITGILPTVQNGHIGLALKLFQRAWALERGILHVRWTFDPLVARNAYFNVSKLGAFPIEYLPRFYAPMNDSLNGGADSDRLLIDWAIGSSKVSDVVSGVGKIPTPESLGASELLSVSAAGLPLLTPTENRFVTVATPNDVYALRKSDPAAANDWRLAVREALGGVLAENGVVVAVTRTGKYVLDRAPGAECASGCVGMERL